MNGQPWGARLPLFFLPAILILFYFTASQHFSYTPDDTYIYLQVARNVANGEGVSFNPGEPTYAVTGPLWMFLVAAGGKLGIDYAIAAKALDLFAASMSILLFYFLAYEMIRESMVALLATLSFSVNIWLVRWAGTGMETSIATLLFIAAFLFTMRNEYLLATVLAALLTLVRPEAAIVIGVIIIDMFLNSVDRRRARKSAAMILGVFLTLLVPWNLYAWLTFGTIVPNTAAAKSNAGWDPADSGIELLNSLKIIAASDAVAALVLAISGLILLRQLRRKGSPAAEERFFILRQSVTGLGWVLLLPLSYAAMHVHVVSRYLLLIVPLIIIFSFGFLFRAMLNSWLSKFAYAGVVLLAGLIITQNQIVYRLVVRPGIEAFQVGMETSLITIAQWLKENTGPEDRVLLWDIGAVGYYSQRNICDGAGLATPAAIPYVKAGYTIRELVDEKIYPRLCDVTYVLHRSDKPEELAHVPHLTALMARPFYRMGLLRTDVQYYTLYKVNKNLMNLEP